MLAHGSRVTLHDNQKYKAFLVRETPSPTQDRDNSQPTQQTIRPAQKIAQPDRKRDTTAIDKAKQPGVSPLIDTGTSKMKSKRSHTNAQSHMGPSARRSTSTRLAGGESSSSWMCGFTSRSPSNFAVTWRGKTHGTK